MSDTKIFISIFESDDWGKETALGQAAIDLEGQLLQKYPELKILNIHMAYRDKNLFVQSIEVKPESRNRGVGTRVMQEILDWAKTNGVIVTLSPEAGPGKKAALEKFYKNLGFTKNSGRKRDYSLSGTRIVRP